MKNQDVSVGKRRMGMVNPAGKSYEEGSPEEEASEPKDEAQAEGDTEDQSGVGQEAEEIVNSIGDNHDLCMAVYGLLKEKYDKEEADQKDETSSEGAKTPAGNSEYSSDGMPTD